jgi:CRISPR-associated protein Cas2
MSTEIIVVTYDITDDRRRRRLSKQLDDFGRRVQKSVYDCPLSERRLLELRQAVLQIIDPDTDSVRYYHLCPRCADRTEVVGPGTVTRQRDLVFV